MTKKEWLDRCAARYVAQGGISTEAAPAYAQACFEEQDGEFLESADYSPEDCADEDMSYRTDDSGG